MPKPTASAFPRKRFFLEMFTRDISLDDCILDLIDNSIDSLVRRDSIDVEKQILSPTKPLTEREQQRLPRVDVHYGPDSFTISDNCGGISRTDARTDAFNFGHSQHVTSSRRLGAYGIGMKRAIFKIGNSFQIESKTPDEGFSMDINVEEWAKKDDNPEDWVFPLKYTDGAKSPARAGTKISIHNFSEAVAMAFGDKTLRARLHRQIAKTYSLFLDRFVSVYLNDTNCIHPIPIPLGKSKDVQPSIAVIQDGDVAVRIVANFAAKGDKGTWESETAGWYVLCNGRVVLAADKSDMTGWGTGILPQFQPKFRGFVGLVSFHSDDPLKLPWTTTKRALERDAPVYQRIRSRMAAAAMPIIRQLEKFYSPEKSESVEEKKVADAMQQADVVSVSMQPESSFQLKAPSKSRAKTTTQVNFPVKVADLGKVRKHLRQPSMTKSSIGEYVFDYFMRSEGLK